MVKGPITSLPFNVCSVLTRCSLEKRRRRADLILAYVIFHGRYDLSHGIFFTLPSCSHLRCHDLKLCPRSFHLARWKTAFSVRIVEPWNKLLPFISNLTSIGIFKNQQDACWETIFVSDEPQQLLPFLCMVQRHLCIYDQYLKKLSLIFWHPNPKQIG